MAVDGAIFNRANLLLGDAVMKEVFQKNVILFGVGGVGSWCAEGLIRSGVQRLTIVDNDRVSVTNINRQLMATVQTVGQVKVEALRNHLLQINPDAEITARNEVFAKETAENFHLEDYDYIIDAIDSLKDKALLILKACETKAAFFSSMGAALKLDPTKVRVAEFWKVQGCPLARALRTKFRSQKTLPKKKFQCVYSEELLENRGVNTLENLELQNRETGFHKAQINGSLVHITGVFGFTIAGLVLEDIARNSDV